MIIFVLNFRDQRRSYKQPIAARFPRNFTSAWFSPGRPLWLRRITTLSCRFNARLLTGRGVVYPRPVMAVPAVLPQYLLPGSRPLVPFENNRRIVFADGLIRLSKFSRRRHGRERFASHVVGFEKPFFRTIFRNFSNIFSIAADVWKLRAETGQTARRSRSDFCIQ